MGCALQLTDTYVAMRLKNRSAYELHDLRLELHKLAETEGTRAIFRCGAYEVLRALTGAIEKLTANMDEEDAMLKAGRRNGWLNIRPCLSSGDLSVAAVRSGHRGCQRVATVCGKTGLRIG
jgi:hypothetical protein